MLKEVARDLWVLLEDLEDVEPRSALKSGGPLWEGEFGTRWGDVCLDAPLLALLRVGQGCWFSDEVNLLLKREPVLAKNPSRPLVLDALAFCISASATTSWS